MVNFLQTKGSEPLYYFIFQKFKYIYYPAGGSPGGDFLDNLTLLPSWSLRAVPALPASASENERKDHHQRAAHGFFHEVDFPVHGTMAAYRAARGYEDAARVEKSKLLYGDNV